MSHFGIVITPVPPATTAPSQPAIPSLPGAGVPAQLAHPPPGIASAIANQVFQGTVIGREGGALMVRTQHGTVALQTQANLPAGAQVALTVTGPSAGGGVAFALHLIGGQGGAVGHTGGLPPGITPALGTVHATPAAGVGAAGAPVATVGAALLTATVMTAVAGEAPPAAVGGLPGGSGMPGAGALPAAAAGASAGVAASGAAAGGAAAGAGGIAGAVAGLISLGENALSAVLPSGASSPSLVPGSQWLARIHGAAPPGATLPPLPAPSAGGAAVLEATVTGLAASGEPLLTLPGGATIALSGASGLTIGSRVAIELAGPREATPGQALSPQARALLAFARLAPDLDTVLQVLERVDPAVALQVLNTLVPKLGSPQLATSMIFLFSALRGGDVRGWLGGQGTREVERGLGKAGRGELLDRLGERFAEAGRAVRDAGPGQWKSFPVPVATPEGQIHAVGIFVRDLPPEEGQEEGSGGKRFIVQLALSELGDLQLDGMVKDRRFDLILRAGQAFDEGQKAEITRIFQEGLQITGYKGQISFQQMKNFPVNPLEEGREPHNLPGIVV